MNQRGFTLVEVLITGILSSVLGGVVLTIFYVNNTQVKEGAAELKLSQEQAAVAEHITNDVRWAHALRKSGEPNGNWNSPPASAWTTPPYQDSVNSPAITGLSEVIVTKLDGSEYAGYRISGDYLDTLVPNSNPRVYNHLEIFPGDTVRVDGDSSYFGIMQKRRGLEVRLRLYRLEDGDTVFLPPHQDNILCRNSDAL